MKKIIKWFKSGISLGGVIVLLIISIVSGFLVRKHYTKIGSILKSRQIGEAADICRQEGGLLLVNNSGDGLELVCQTIQIEIEVPVDCSKQEELIKHLIRKDYIRGR